MSTYCPTCRSIIAIDDINVATDIALCRSCGNTFAFSEIADRPVANSPDLAAPPKGAWFEQFPGGFRTGATTRSWMALFIVPFTCVWAGLSVGDIFGRQISSGKFDPAASFFGLPFLIFSIVLVGMCAMTVAGKVELTQREDKLTVFTGIGLLGWSRSLQWSDFSSVREDSGSNGFNWNGQRRCLALEGRRKVVFGSMWSEERRYFILSALRTMLRSTSGLRVSSTARPLFR